MRWHLNETPEPDSGDDDDGGDEGDEDASA
jgi:hypothetical protein